MFRTQPPPSAMSTKSYDPALRPDTSASTMAGNTLESLSQLRLQRD